MPTAIARAVWQDPSRPVAGPPRKARFRRGVVHHEGVTRDRTPADIAAYLRQMQSSYLASRGYSLGYGFGVVSDVRHPADGTRWEIRGADLNMASNPGRKWAAEGRSPTGNANDWTGSVLIIGPTGVRVSAKASTSVREIFAEWHAEAGTSPVRPLPHMALDWTSCCGESYLADLNAGLFDPHAQPPPPSTIPPATPIPAGDDMIHALAQPARNSDTRGFGGVGVAPGVPMKFGLNPSVVPADAVAVALNVAAVGATEPGFVTVWPSGPITDTSIINYEAGGAHNGAIICGVVDGSFMIQTSTRAHLFVDITAYWAA